MLGNISRSSSTNHQNPSPFLFGYLKTHSNNLWYLFILSPLLSSLSLTTLHLYVQGSLYALWKLGPEVVDLLILPSIPSLHQRTASSPQTMKLVNEILRHHFTRMCSNAMSSASEQQQQQGGGGVAVVQEQVRLQQVEVWRGAYGEFADAVFAAAEQDQDIEMGRD